MSTTADSSIFAGFEHLDITPDMVSTGDDAVVLIELPDSRPITEPLLHGISQIPGVQSVDPHLVAPSRTARWGWFLGNLPTEHKETPCIAP